MTNIQRFTLAMVVAVLLVLTGLIAAAWPATGSVNPVVTPTTYGPPGPDGGPQ